MIGPTSEKDDFLMKDESPTEQWKDQDKVSQSAGSDEEDPLVHVIKKNEPYSNAKPSGKERFFSIKERTRGGSTGES